MQPNWKALDRLGMEKHLVKSRLALGYIPLNSAWIENHSSGGTWLGLTSTRPNWMESASSHLALMEIDQPNLAWNGTSFAER